MDASFSQTSFLGGEWSKFAQGRWDRAEYRTALNVALNCFPLEQGALVRRPGTMFAQTTYGGRPGLLLSFDFKHSQPYLIELTDGFMRFFQGSNPVTTNDDLGVSAISSANPAEVTTGTHGWSTGNTVMFANLGSQTPLLQNRQFKITVTAANKFTIVDAVSGVAMDGSTLGTLAITAMVKRVLELATPYVNGAWSDVRIVQNELSAEFLHGSFPPYVLTAISPGVGQPYYQFTFSQATFIDGPYLDPFRNGVRVTPTAVSGIVTLTLSFPAYSATTAYTIGAFVTDGGVSYVSLIDQNVGNTPASSPTVWQSVAAGTAIGPNGFVGTDIGRHVRIQDSASNWTWGKIVSLANLISGSLAGSTNIGNMTGGGGLAAAFDNVTTQTSANGASLTTTNTDPTNAYVGKNYSGASTQKIQSATYWSSSDLGFASAKKSYVVYTFGYRFIFGSWQRYPQVDSTVTVTDQAAAVTSIVFNLRAKQTAPSNSADGTLLGSSSSISGANVSILSNNTSTAWNYVWIEAVATYDLSMPSSGLPNNPIEGQVSGIVTSSLTSSGCSVYCAEAQFFSPVAAGSGSAVNIEIIGPALADTTARSNWRIGAYSETTAWPSCGTYHDGRLWLGGAISNRIDGSVSNNPLTFSPTQFTAGTVVDSNAISATFNGPDVNQIFWLATDVLGILCGTQAGMWLVQQSTSGAAITPTNISARRFDRIGCTNVEPRRAYQALIVVQRWRRKLYEYFADVYSGKFLAQNISWSSRHLTKPGIAQLAFQTETSPIIWARCDDGSIFGITYKRESFISSQPPNFSAPHRHVLGSGRVVESIVVGPSVDGLVDSLAMITNDPATNVRHVEIMTPILEEGEDQTSAWYLDDAVIPSSQSASASALTVNGLWHLNGNVVTVFAGGLDCGDYTVVNGSISVPFGDGINDGPGGGQFTAVLADASQIIVGFTFTTQGQIVRPITEKETGARNGPALGKKRRSSQFAALLENTVGGSWFGSVSGLQFGTDFTRMKPALFRTQANQNYGYGAPFSGVFWDTLVDDSTFDGMLCWQISRPYAVNIIAVEPFIMTQDK